MAKKVFTAARILAAFSLDGCAYKPDQVVEFESSLANHLAEQGSVDKHKDAIQYALGQGAKVQRHTSPDSGAETEAETTTAPTATPPAEAAE